jgi:hypothetical protein
MCTFCHIAVLVVFSTLFIEVLLVGECLKLFTLKDDNITGLSWTTCGSFPEFVSLTEADFLYFTAWCSFCRLMMFHNYIMGISTYFLTLPCMLWSVVSPSLFVSELFCHALCGRIYSMVFSDVDAGVCWYFAAKSKRLFWFSHCFVRFCSCISLLKWLNW